MTTKCQIAVVVKMVDVNANPPVAQGRITVFGKVASWKASMGKVPIVEIEGEVPKWSVQSLKDAILGAIGRANVPCEYRTVIQEPQ
jgi:hypothetical protein